jgi:c-di-GMP-specific phosphodiesterase
MGMADTTGGEFPADRMARIDAAHVAILAATGDLRAVADALVTQATKVTNAVGSSLFEMRGGQWVRTSASRGIAGRPITFALSSGELITRPLLVTDASDASLPVSRIAQSFGIPCLAVVPLYLWPDVPAMISISGDSPGSLRFDDLAVLSVLAITAAAAAYHTPSDHARSSQAVKALAWHQQMLEAIARGASLDESLRRICLEVQARYPDTRCTVLLADHSLGVLRHAAGPSLPHSFRAAIDGMAIGDSGGACGMAAASGQPVVVADVLTDASIAGFLQVAAANDVRAVWSYPLVDAAGEVLGTFALYRAEPHTPDAEEIATVAAVAGIAALAIERYRAERALTEAAHRDPLTSLCNRVMFHQLLADALQTAAQTSSACAVLFLDLDGFKTVNDSLGHAAGDRMLIEVADRLTRRLPGGCVVSRFGGDEFTILVESATTERVDHIADLVDAALLEPFEIDGGEFFLTTAIGIAMSDQSSTDPGTVVRDADAAMYAAKSRGRGRRAVFDTPLRDRAVARVAIEADLRRAIREGSLDVVYQPIIDLVSHRWCGAEVLVRWDHPALGGVLPADFIPVAEELGLMGQLGAHVLARAMAQARIWDDAGIGVPIAVNISPSQLTDPEVVREILRAIEVAAVRADLIYLEITESAVMENPELAKRLLTEFAAAGIRSVIDDFGTGHSSIARLSELPVTGVKIDKSFLTPLGRESGSTRVVAAIIDLAHAFSLTVTAEGVESAAALHVLEYLGCDQAQGYLFGRPCAAAETAALLATDPSSYDGKGR